ncbi:DUF2141 domain-containing protein [Maribacter sp. MJ134]|uniref:DUF2141 domain-containing protein n=1 Tax=Maribacter sp. MJ134 TaxID=2496865 RepID=UPI000F841AB8|nr:DUF2141 domain-containing protein [Maribacter sp. MJ134]AZQ59498.1 DUF2141 domain-containing protein [Maribacter sp. MJ134]
MKKIISSFLILMVYAGFSQHNLSLKIEGVPSNAGAICAAVYKDHESFLKFDKVYKMGSKKATEGNTIIQINDIPEGNYAVAIFHDENGNDVLDTNMFGIPKEAVAFSKAKMKMFGPPRFDECAFKIVANTEITIVLD